MSFNYDETIKQIFKKKNKENENKINIEKSEEKEIKNYSNERENNINKYNNIGLDSKNKVLYTKINKVNKIMKNQKINKNNLITAPKKISYLEREKRYSSRNHYILNGHISEFLNNKLNINENENKHYNSISKKEKNHSITKNKFERYNTENIKYEAIKNYNQFKPKNKNFLDRMKFYSMKKQLEDEFLNRIVEKTIPKIKESEKLKIFNNLIKDSNRRTEGKNRVEIINKNDNIFKELLNQNEKKPKIKFNEKEFIQKYNENIDKLKKKEEDLELLRKKKKEEEEKKENDLIYEMRKRNKKASRKTIEKISKRLYNDAISQRLKKHIKNSKSQIINFQKPFFNKPKHRRNLTPFEIYNTNNNIKKVFNEEKIITDYNSSKIKNTYPNTFNNTFSNKIKENKNHKYQSAEKMIDSFFLFSKQK